MIDRGEKGPTLSVDSTCSYGGHLAASTRNTGGYSSHVIK